MRNKLLLLLSVSVAFACSTKPADTLKDHDSMVNQFIGTGYHGHTFLGASVPFGAIQVGTQNIVKGWDWCSGYHYSDSVAIGFSHTHMNGTGISDGGDLLIMPYTGRKMLVKGEQDAPEKGYASRYSHDREAAELNYYSLILDDYNIKAELTATERAAMHRYTFAENADTARIIIDLKEGSGWDSPSDSYIEKRDDNTIVGYRYSDGWGLDQKFYYVIKFEKPIDIVEMYADTVVVSGGKVTDKWAKALITYKNNPKEVLFKVGVSPVSIENAILNLDTEIGDWNFENVVDSGRGKWNKMLSKVEIESMDDSINTIFYTALYHTMISPNLYNDVNGDYRGTDKKIYKGANFENYTMLSLWDTYRAANPMYTLLMSEKVDGMINTMLEIYRQQGKLPIWHLRGSETNTMVGYSAVPIVVDAYMKGFSGFDAELAYEAVKASAMYDERGVDYIKKIGFIPYDKDWESVAKALEYCQSDWAISQMAARMGKTEDAAYFAERAKLYTQYFDSETKLFRGKNEKGEWDPTFGPTETSRPWIENYTEGNAVQYRWLVPHDVEGLIELLGGENEFNRLLDGFFEGELRYAENSAPDITGIIGQYAHGNEPGHHTIYLYAYSGQQWKTAEKARYIMSKMYSTRPEGIIGNEDCGQMSAWYVLSSLGFYPVNASNGAYVFGSPMINHAMINLADGKQFEITAENNSPQNIYIQRVELDGKPYTKSYITHKDIVKGGTLKYYMDSKPNYDFGAEIQDRPHSIVY